MEITTPQLFKKIIMSHMKKDEIKLISALAANLNPPLGVAVKHGIGGQIVINILLKLLGFRLYLYMQHLLF